MVKSIHLGPALAGPLQEQPLTWDKSFLKSVVLVIRMQDWAQQAGTLPPGETPSHPDVTVGIFQRWGGAGSRYITYRLAWTSLSRISWLGLFAAAHSVPGRQMWDSRSPNVMFCFWECECFDYTYVCAPHVCLKFSEGIRFPAPGFAGGCKSLETKPVSSVRATRVINCWVICLAPNFFWDKSLM